MKSGEPPSLTKIQNEVIRMIKKHREEREKRKMEALKSLFSSKTNHGRVIRTLLQAFVGLSTLMLGIFAIPEFYDLFERLPLVVQLGGMAVAVAFVTAVQNYGTKFLEYIKEW